MHKYFLKIPWWIRVLYPDYLWKVQVPDKTVFLTFDDGPHPTITPWVLQQLKQYNATATFFCIGKNVVQFPDVYAQIIAAGHAVGNHTFSHLNGWKTTPDEIYLADAAKAADLIDSPLFRPPYGRIKKQQAQKLSIMLKKYNVKIVMWDVLSADFDTSFSPKACINTVLRHTRPGSVIVFHDSEKAFGNLQIALPTILKELHSKGFDFQRL
jgi:peptidoglycan/xylan/chitin deacetylase (PgdA/CDA1 family)